MLIAVRDTRLYVEVNGFASDWQEGRLITRPSMVCLHGGPGATSFGYRHPAYDVSGLAQLICYDQRGCGQSPACDPATYTMDESIEDLEALRVALGLERWIVLGVSYGGMLAQGYALRYPERVLGLVLVVTAPSYRFLDDARQQVEQRGSAEQRRICQLLWDASFATPEQFDEFSRLMAPFYTYRPAPEPPGPPPARLPFNLEALNRGFGGYLRTYDFLPDLPRLTCPALVMGGERDWICSANQSRQLAAALPRAHLKLFPDCAHSLAAEATDAYRAALRGFLTHFVDPIPAP